jgi:hypothetical protein
LEKQGHPKAAKQSEAVAMSFLTGMTDNPKKKPARVVLREAIEMFD